MKVYEKPIAQIVSFETEIIMSDFEIGDTSVSIQEGVEDW